MFKFKATNLGAGRLTRRPASLLLGLLILLGLLGGLLPESRGQAEDFADPAFSRVWERSDKAVAEGKVSRVWLWGPQPNANRPEVYAEAPSSKRLVQYFDKSRMELTNPAGDKNSRWYVTNGLLTVELVTGQLQVGDSAYENRTPSNESVGGDPANPGPTYASFGKLISLNGSNRAEPKSSSAMVDQKINRAGIIGAASLESAKLARYAYYEPKLGHNIPDVFWNWMQKLDEEWVFAMGLPITEPYWAKFTVGGNEQELLVQLFERRVLTFNPANAPVWQVEMGNIGQHYYSWRYGPPPTTAIPVSGATNTPGSRPPSQTTGSGASPTSGNTSTPTSTPIFTGTPVPSPTGGSNSTATATGTPSTPGSTGTPSPSVSPTTVPGEEEKKLIELINQYRGQNGVPDLKMDERLFQAARWMSEDMAKLNYLGHIDSKGRDYIKRLADFGYNDAPQSETVIGGYQAQATLDYWKNSAGSNSVLLDPQYKAFGVGYAYNAEARYKHYWTIDFGGK